MAMLIVCVGKIRRRVGKVFESWMQCLGYKIRLTNFGWHAARTRPGFSLSHAETSSTDINIHVQASSVWLQYSQSVIFWGTRLQAQSSYRKRLHPTCSWNSSYNNCARGLLCNVRNRKRACSAFRRDSSSATASSHVEICLWYHHWLVTKFYTKNWMNNYLEVQSCCPELTLIDPRILPLCSAAQLQKRLSRFIKVYSSWTIFRNWFYTQRRISSSCEA